MIVATYQILTNEQRKVRVVSLPSTDVFDVQDDSYREAVLPKAVTATIEAGSIDYWYKYVGLNGDVVGITTFWKSAPAEQLFYFFDKVLSKARQLLN